MADVVIENPILNSPYSEPTLHFRFNDDGITNEVAESRRKSAFFIPIAKPKKKGKQLVFDTEWTQDRIQPNDFINRVRERVGLWRQGGYKGVTRVTRQLLEHWQRPDRERPLFFCQLEAVETAIYLTECATNFNDAWIANGLREQNEQYNNSLDRSAFKMATGSGKTVVMAMLIAWQALNKLANPRDAKFSDAFLIVTPGITIRDRLRVLLPNDPDNYYKKFDVAPLEQREQLNKAKIVITNFHAFQPRERMKAGRLTKAILAGRNAEQASPFTETPAQMVRRVCRDLGEKHGIMVINDEAHHCYRLKPIEAPEVSADGAVALSAQQLRGEEKKEAEERDRDARVWISGLEAVKKKIGIKGVYDLSATPFFLRGSGYPEGTLFPWAVSDFSLIDAIECGIVKVPRVPVSDNTMEGDQPTYRELWLRIRDSLPKKGAKSQELGGKPELPAELQGALHSLYGHYKKQYALWYEQFEKAMKIRDGGGSIAYLTPPVFIVVCSNTSVSKLVYDWISGYEFVNDSGNPVIATGALELFSNVEGDQWSARPNSILVDSHQLESGEAMSPEFKKAAAREIEEFKAEYRQRFPGRDADDLSDEDLLREVMNTIGKPGRLGEQVKCVVSVSMLTEGWDANTVTHILGVRAFSTQLLCEQVVGRGLRRRNYTPNEDGLFEPEYAEVYGVPFSFIPCAGSGHLKPIRPVTRVRALEERIACEITFPRIFGYRYDLPSEHLVFEFTEDSCVTLSTADIPTRTENAPIVGQSVIHNLDELKQRRPQEVAFLLGKLVLEKYFRQDGEQRPEHTSNHRYDPGVKAWLFPQVLEISQRWLDECVTCRDDTFPQLLLLIEYAHNAADRIYQAIVRAETGEKRLVPILAPYDTVGSSKYVDFDTSRPVWPTREDKCHVSHVVCDTETWEQKMAQALEDMDEVEAYVKNENLGFLIPYTIDGEEHNYMPDFVVHIRLNGTAEGAEPLNLIVEVSGQPKKKKAVKVQAARSLWVPAVNNHGGFGRWGFIEIKDPWDAKNLIRAHLAEGVVVESAGL